MSKKKMMGLILFGGVLPLALTFIGLPLWLVSVVSLSASCVIDGMVIYKIIKWVRSKPVAFGFLLGRLR